MLLCEFQPYPPDHPDFMHFADFLSYRFVSDTFLLGALRSVQFERFNSAGLGACEFDLTHYQPIRFL